MYVYVCSHERWRATDSKICWERERTENAQAEVEEHTRRCMHTSMIKLGQLGQHDRPRRGWSEDQGNLRCSGKHHRPLTKPIHLSTRTSKVLAPAPLATPQIITDKLRSRRAVWNSKLLCVRECVRGFRAGRNVIDRKQRNTVVAEKNWHVWTHYEVGLPFSKTCQLERKAN